MKKNIPRFLAWLLLLCGLAGGPGAARLGSTISPGILRWLVTAGAALMIISFFWFPRRVEGHAPAKSARVRLKKTAVRRKAVTAKRSKR